MRAGEKSDRQAGSEVARRVGIRVREERFTAWAYPAGPRSAQRLRGRAVRSPPPATDAGPAARPARTPLAETQGSTHLVRPSGRAVHARRPTGNTAPAPPAAPPARHRTALPHGCPARPVPGRTPRQWHDRAHATARP